VIGGGGRAEQFREDGLQSVGPHLISLDRGMKIVAVHHAFEELAVFVGQLVIDVEVSDFLPVRKLRKVRIDFVDSSNDRDVVVAGKDCRQDDRGVGRLRAHDIESGLETFRDVRNFCVVAARRHCPADIVGTGQEHDDLRIYAVQFAVVQAPQNILNGVGTPAEVGGIPSEEILFPVG